jgi:carbonic anhydrase
MDSRTSVELIFDQGLGDVFSTRVAGNVIRTIFSEVWNIPVSSQDLN